MKKNSILSENIIKFTYEEGGVFLQPSAPVKIGDIVSCEKTINARNHVVWNRPKILGGLDCHSFVIETNRRFDAFNHFRE